MFRIILAFLCIALAFASERKLSEGCDDSNVQVGTCSIHEHVCYGFYNWQWVYTAVATSPNGKSADSGGNQASSDGAAYRAMYNLFTKLDMTGPDTYDCNCAVQDKQLNGMCTLRVGVCYYFASLGDCQNHQVVYKAYAYDQATGNQANSASTNPAGFTNSTDAAVTAVTNLIMNFPLEAKACGYGVADHEKIAAHMLI